jgi:hypothetical protein
VLGGVSRAAGDVTIKVGRSGVTLRTPNNTYGVRSPLYLDSSPGQLNTGIPVGVRSPLVKVGGNVPDTGAPFSRIVDGGGLQAHEDAGGHLLLKHVGQSEQSLMTRLANEPKISGSSSFYDRATAEKAISEALDANRSDISSWLSGNKPQMTVTYAAPENIGITLPRGASSGMDTAKLKLILRRDPSTSIGYRIQTGFPEL